MRTGFIIVYCSVTDEAAAHRNSFLRGFPIGARRPDRRLSRIASRSEVEVVAFDLPGLEDAVLGSNGLRAGGWDLAIFPTDWIGSAINTAAIENLTPWMHSNPLPDWPEGWPASLREPLRHGEDFYCIPWHDGPECLIYRKDLFENPEEQKAFAAQSGRELKPPITWEEFHETARFFTRPSQSLVRNPLRRLSRRTQHPLRPRPASLEPRRRTLLRQRRSYAE